MENRLREWLPFWRYLDGAERGLLILNTKAVRYKSGENVCGCAKNPGILLVQSGTLLSYVLSGNGRVVGVHRLMPGSVCVLAALTALNPAVPDFYMDACEDSEVLAVPVEAIMKLSKKNTYVKEFLHDRSIGCLSKVITAMEEQLFMSLDMRLENFLFSEASRKKSCEIRITHEQIADAIGSAREVVSRALKRMSDGHRIAMFRGGIRILDPKLSTARQKPSYTC